MLVGNFLTNNPFGNSPFDTTIGSTLGYPLIINTDASGNITDVRTAFNNHAYAVLNGSVYDACAGPVIELTLTNYFGIAIDFDANKQWNALLIALGRDVNIEGFYETTTEIINAVQYFTINVLR